VTTLTVFRPELYTRFAADLLARFTTIDTDDGHHTNEYQNGEDPFIS
jgi:hypothetical protein